MSGTVGTSDLPASCAIETSATATSFGSTFASLGTAKVSSVAASTTIGAIGASGAGGAASAMMGGGDGAASLLMVGIQPGISTAIGWPVPQSQLQVQGSAQTQAQVVAAGGAASGVT